jgi:hypothetical protein
MSTLKTVIEWNSETGEEREIEVFYTYHRACRGQRDSCCGVRGAGPPLEPDEPAMVEVDRAMMHDPTFHDRAAMTDVWDQLSEKQQERIEEECLQATSEPPEREYDPAERER